MTQEFCTECTRGIYVLPGDEYCPFCAKEKLVVEIMLEEVFDE